MSHDGIIFGRWDFFDDIMIILLVSIESLSAWDQERTVYEFRPLPISPNYSARLIGLPYQHNDPFDRLLVAQSLGEGLPLVISDEVFDFYSVARIWR